MYGSKIKPNAEGPENCQFLIAGQMFYYRLL